MFSQIKQISLYIKMRMQKKQLQISTNFLDEQKISPKIIRSQKTNYEQKIQSAIILQKLLSIILAKNFIQCWKQLKNILYSCKKIKKISRSTNKKIDKTNNYIMQQKCHSSSIQNYKNNKYRSQSQPFINLKTQRSFYAQDDQYKIKRNKSTRVINQQIQNSRATILKDIVQKLKYSKKIKIDSQDDQNNLEVFKRIAHLQRIVRSMKHSSNRNDIYQSNAYLGFSNSRTDSKNKSIHFQQLPNTEQQQLMKQFMQQIQIIRKQITQIKNNNQLILKTEIQRSQISQHSSRKNKSVHHFQEQTKPTLTEAVQTIQRQPALAQLQEKIRKLAEEAAIFNKSTTNTYVNGSYLGVSGAESRQSDKYLLNLSYKNNASNQNPYLTSKTNPLIPVTQNHQFTETTLNNNGLQYRPSNVATTMIPYQSQTYSFQQAPSSMSFNRTNLQPVPQVATIITKPSIHFEYPKFDHIKTTTTTATFQNRNGILDSVPSTSLIGRGFSQPSSFIYPKNSNIQESKKNVTFTNYCSSCGRSCACPKIFPQNRRF